MTTIGFIGTGTITAAMVAGLCAAPASPAQILVGPRSADKAADLARRFTQVTVAADNQSVVNGSDWLVLAVPPQVAHAVVSELKFKPGQRILSLIAPVDDQWLDAAVAPGRLAARIFAASVSSSTSALRSTPAWPAHDQHRLHRHRHDRRGDGGRALRRA